MVERAIYEYQRSLYNRSIINNQNGEKIMTVERLRNAIEKAETVHFWTKGVIGEYETITKEEAFRLTKGLTVNDLNIFDDRADPGFKHGQLWLGLHTEESRNRQAVAEAVEEVLQETQSFMIKQARDRAKALAEKVGKSQDEMHELIVRRIRVIRR